jgi:nucleotide-binding universal stress UspA family protein
MKKIIIPFDGGHFSDGAFKLASILNETNPVLLTGVFLPEVDFAKIFFFPTAFAAPVYIPGAEEFEEKTIERNIKVFKELCQKNNIKYNIHKDLYDTSIAMLTKESRFADLMIVGSEVFYTNGSGGPFEYLKDTLHHAECPVMIVPEKFKQPSQVILAYDGSESSVYAIKQFAYLFPELCKLDTKLVYFGDEKKEIPRKESIEELARAHFDKFSMTSVSSEDENSFDEWLSEHWNPILVSGSFNRSGISALFKRSFVMRTIIQHKTSVFIAHD